MFRKTVRAFAGVAVVALVVGALAVPSGASTRRGQAPQGIDSEKIQIVGIVPDLDKLIARGIPLSGLNTQAFLDRLVAHTDAYGPIRGRAIEWIKVGWDPQDSTSFDKACTEATIDNKPFLVINSSGFRDSAIPCVVVDNNTPYMSADMMPETLTEAAGKNLISLALPPEVAGAEGVRFIAKNKMIPKSAKIGILSNNIPGVKSAADSAEKEFTKRGYDVASKVEVNGLVSDANILRREVGVAAGTFQAAGVDTVFNVQSMTQTGAFFDEAVRLNYKPSMFAVDGQGQACTKDGAAGLPPTAAGYELTCISAFDGRAEVGGTAIRADSEFEAECRANFEAKRGFKSVPGQRSGGVTVNGVKYEEDLSPNECTILNLLLPAIKKAGKNPTWNKVYKNIMAVDSAPAAYMSDGEGGFGPNKPYFANKIHAMKLALVNAQTPKAANGTYNGCPTVISCYIPIEIDGQEWFPISSAAG